MNELEQIKRQIEEFKIFKKKIEDQQLSYPIDIKSTDTMKQDVLIRPKRFRSVQAGLGPAFNEAIEVIATNSGNKYLLLTTAPFVLG